jgi:dienelactone hydrolase
MLMLLGSADEMNEPAPCEHLAAWLKDHGVPVRVVTYANAQHGFDDQRPVVFDRNFVGIRNCEAEYDLDTRTIRRLDTKRSLTREAVGAWVHACRHKGARFGGNAKALEASISDVRTFLLDALGK